MKYFSLFSFAFLIIFCNGIERFDYFKTKPTFLDTCNTKQKNYKKCTTDSMQKFVDQTVIGIPELEAVFGIQKSSQLNDVHFSIDNLFAKFNANVSGIVIEGFSKAIIKENIINTKDYSFDTKIFVPSLRIRGYYESAGTAMTIPLYGSGKFVGDIENLEVEMHTKTRLVEREGLTFFDVEKVTANVYMTGIRVDFGMGDEINALFNDNWRLCFAVASTFMKPAFEEKLTSMIKASLAAIPAKYIIEDIPKPSEFYKETGIWAFFG